MVSPLLTLPGELRNRIFELASYHPRGITVSILTGEPRLIKDDGDENDRSPMRNLLALSITNSQLRRETSSLIYALNNFKLVARPKGQRYKNSIWQRGMRTWLDQIGAKNIHLLEHVEIDIGTSFMYDIHPSPESLWRSVSSLFYLFPSTATKLYMSTELCWVSRSTRSFTLVIPLRDTALARRSIAEALDEQRRDLERWLGGIYIATGMEAGYRRMELETCGQELRSFVNLLECCD